MITGTIFGRGPSVQLNYILPHVHLAVFIVIALGVIHFVCRISLLNVAITRLPHCL